VVGDVLSGCRSLFDVPVAETSTYRVTVETVDWVKECCGIGLLEVPRAADV
jgi:hypothetical protein